MNLVQFIDKWETELGSQPSGASEGRGSNSVFRFAAKNGGAIQIQQIVVTSTLKAKAVQDLTGVLMAILS